MLKAIIKGKTNPERLADLPKAAQERSAPSSSSRCAAG